MTRQAHLPHAVAPAGGQASPRGFTLIELMVVIAILAILMAIAIPTYFRFINKARNVKALAELNTLEKKIRLFELQNDRLPRNLSEIQRQNLIDPWGQAYEYVNLTNAATAQPRTKGGENLNTDYDLFSLGKDGRTAADLDAAPSADDIVRAGDGQFFGIAADVR